jgi:UDP-N-acetylmuramoyl-L-alanyl-D-glutamate--2,6-diaminopimelate ligase
MIRTNSSKVLPGDVFVALIGDKVDGHNYVEDAIKNGASKVVVQYGTYSVPTITVADTKQYIIDYVKEYYLPRLKKIKLIGVTGTNGKTTCSFLIYQMLKEMGINASYIGTIGFYINEDIKKLDNTTPDILSLYQMLDECVEKGITYVAMEVSSHALALNRIEGLTFDYAIFTNLTQDHLDFHKNMENYALTKQKLFNLLKENGKSIINIDDDYSSYMKMSNYITYGFDKSDYQILNYSNEQNNTLFTFKTKEDEYIVNSPLLGKYNVYNLLTMIIVLHQEGFKMESILEKVHKLKAPDGRMDTIIYKDNKIIIDYAHTPDAVFNILNAVREFSKGRIYSIIGCGGNRDKTKRPIMAFYALALSDKVIMTNDNPRFEDPLAIINDMLHNNIQNNYEIILDRKDAIKRGIELLNNGDTLIILGKGHEDYQIINGENLYHNDKEYVLKICRG